MLIRFIIAVALCKCIIIGSSFFSTSFMPPKRARQTTNEAGVTTFFCDTDNCTFEANSSSSLKRHKINHSNELLHCDITGCSFETTHSSSLKRHKSDHTTICNKINEPLHCDFPGCPFETIHSSNLKRHKTNHTSICKCDFNGCNFETNTTSKLKRHTLNHRKEPVIFNCDVCDYASDIKSNLTRHKKEAHRQPAKSGKRMTTAHS